MACPPHMQQMKLDNKELYKEKSKWRAKYQGVPVPGSKKEKKGKKG